MTRSSASAARLVLLPNLLRDQHSSHIPPGREGLFGLVKNVPGTLRYENQLILANGDFVMLHGRLSGLGPGIANGSWWTSCGLKMVS